MIAVWFTSLQGKVG